MTPPVLRVKGVRVDRGARTVLHDVDFAIAQGQHWVLLGPNGGGKSTLLQLLQGFLWPTCGWVEVLGARFGRHDITRIRPLVGWVGGDIERRFSPGETARSIVESGAVGTVGIQFDIPSTQRRKSAAALMRDLGIWEVRERPFAGLSQGQQRLVDIGRSLLLRPRLLLLDEACEGLDPVAREEFLWRLEVLATRREGPSMLFATHHIEEIRKPFTHALFLRRGRAIVSGPISRILDSDSLSRLFERQLTLARHGGRYSLSLQNQGFRF